MRRNWRLRLLSLALCAALAVPTGSGISAMAAEPALSSEVESSNEMITEEELQTLLQEAGQQAAGGEPAEESVEPVAETSEEELAEPEEEPTEESTDESSEEPEEGTEEPADEESNEDEEDVNEDASDAPANELPAVEPKEEQEEDIDVQSDEIEEIDGKVTSINTLQTSVVSGAERNENGDWVWTATSSGKGHRYTFQVVYDTSGYASMDAAEIVKDADGKVTGVNGGIQIRIPRSILRDKSGEAADKYELAIPSLNDLSNLSEEQLAENNWAYVEIGEEIIVYNRQRIDSAVNGFFNVSYATTKETYSYLDYGADGCGSTEFTATMTASDQEKTSEPQRVYMDTTAKISRVSKNGETPQSKWNTRWGEAPEDSNDYYWQEWTPKVFLDGDLTQNYNLTVKDLGMTCKASNGREVPCEVYGYLQYNDSGKEILLESDYPDGVTIKNTHQGYLNYGRADLKIITRVRKTDLSAGVSYTFTNKYSANVHPYDGVDEDTSKEAVRSFTWIMPEFKQPVGHFIMDKFADENPSITHYNINRTYSSYDLDQFQSGAVDRIEDLQYRVYAAGYPEPWTVDGDSSDPNSYGKIPVTYEISDRRLYPLNIDNTDANGDTRFVGVNGVLEEDLENGTPLNGDDYDITKLRVTITYDGYLRDENGDVELDNNQEFKTSFVMPYAETDVLELYTLTYTADGKGDYVYAGSYNLGTDVFTPAEESLIESVTISGKNNSSGTYFVNYRKDENDRTNVDGFKIVTSNSYYRSSFYVDPFVTLYDTEHVKAWTGTIAAGNAKEELLLKNIGEFRAYQNDEEDIYAAMDMSGDRLKGGEKDSYIKKSVVSASNDAAGKAYDITWRVTAYETSKSGTGVLSYNQQESGTFYDLLPEGAALDRDSVQILIPSGDNVKPGNDWNKNSKVLANNEYDIETIEDYKGSNRTLLIVRIKTPGLVYKMTYTTVHPWDSIADYGADARNPIGYETGNSEIAHGFPDNPDGTTTSGETLDDRGNDMSQENRELYKDLDTSSDDHKFIYDEEDHHISAMTAASASLNKRVKAASDSNWNYDTTVVTDEAYQYRLRYMNNYTSATKNLVLFDTLENFYTSDDAEVGQSEWKGTLTKVDLSLLTRLQNASGNGATMAPVVYYSTIEGLDLDEDDNHNVDNRAVWRQYVEGITDPTTVKALAIDMRYDTTGAEFLLKSGDAVTVQISMKAPHTDPSTDIQHQYPETYNNVYLQDSLLNADGTTVDFYIHHNYTTVRYKVTSGFGVRKVNAQNNGQVIPNIEFHLVGTSFYQNEVDTTVRTDRNGEAVFRDIEKGTYTLTESQVTAGWVLDTTPHTVVIGGDRSVTIDDVNYSPAEDGTLSYITITNEPQVVTDIAFHKVDAQHTATMVEGARYSLSGTSDYGTEVYMTANSGADGSVTFADIEQGTYTLREIKAPEGYTLDGTTYTVVIDQTGSYTITYVETQESGETVTREVPRDRSGIYYLTDVPLHYIVFTKRNSYNKEVLGGATFQLTGTSDQGTQVDMTAVSDETTGTVRFEGLEAGMYVLVETEAPEGYNEDAVKHIVTIGEDGTYEISGLDKDAVSGVYDLYNTRQSGKQIKVKKIWQDGQTNHTPNDLAITIQTKVPEASNRTYQITFNANGGAYDASGEGDTSITLGYNAKNEVTSGTYAAPVWADHTLLGWSTNPNATVVDSNIADTATPNDLKEAYLYSLEDGSETTLYAIWDSGKYAYAVQIYGIEHDTLRDGSTGGLTFGPAVGDDYTKSYKSHTPSGTTASGNEHRCIHDDSWSTIVANNKKDPYIYEQCLENECTQSVVLTLTEENCGQSDRVFKIERSYIHDISKYFVTGDGTGVFGAILDVEARRWRRENDNISFEDLNWSNSNARAVLNGVQNETDERFSQMYYSESNCILSAFPEVLRNNIGAKAVQYSLNDNKVATVYDKLWLFSAVELHGSYLSENFDDSDYYRNEGTEYQRLKNVSPASFGVVAYSYTNVTSPFWTRSLDNRKTGCVVRNGMDKRYMLEADVMAGMAPGFVLAR